MDCRPILMACFGWQSPMGCGRVAMHPSCALVVGDRSSLMLFAQVQVLRFSRTARIAFAGRCVLLCNK